MSPWRWTLGVAGRGRGHRHARERLVGEGQTGRLYLARLDAARGFRPGDFVTVAVQEPPLRMWPGCRPLRSAERGQFWRWGGMTARGGRGDVLRRQGDDVIVPPRRWQGARWWPSGRRCWARASRSDRSAARALRRRGRARHAGTRRGAARAAGRLRRRQSTMPDEARQRVLAQLREPRVPARVVQRIEHRMGG